MKLNTAVLTERNVVIQTDIIESDVPLFLSRDSIYIARVEVAFNLATADHYCVPIERTGMYIAATS